MEISDDFPPRLKAPRLKAPRLNAPMAIDSIRAKSLAKYPSALAEPI
jgi:hypothetical protein